MVNYPSWVLKHKRINTEIKVKENRFYLYEVSSIWNKEKKQAQKKTGQYLGRITEEGFVPKSRSYIRKQPLHEAMAGKISVKEFGASCLLYKILGAQIKERLEAIFPGYWQEILVISILRTIYQCPMKNIESLYLDSYLSNELSILKLSGKQISYLMQEIGRQRDKIVQFMQYFLGN